MYVTVKNLNCLYKHTLKMWLRSELLLRSYGVRKKCPCTVLTRLIVTIVTAILIHNTLVTAILIHSNHSYPCYYVVTIVTLREPHVTRHAMAHIYSKPLTTKGAPMQQGGAQKMASR